MSGRGGGRSGRPQPPRVTSQEDAEKLVRDLRRGQTGEVDYRRRSLRLYGLVCAKCGREFDERNQQLLTVHHKDGNHHNNPADGSNWENLCVYCHDDEHSRSILADYLAGKS
jgi:hypothetical protein